MRLRQRHGVEWRPGEVWRSERRVHDQYQIQEIRRSYTPGNSRTCIRSPRSSLPAKIQPLWTRRSTYAGLTSYLREKRESENNPRHRGGGSSSPMPMPLPDLALTRVQFAGFAPLLRTSLEDGGSQAYVYRSQV